MKNKTIIRTKQFRSLTNLNVVYSAILYNTGEASCNCKGWTNHINKDGTRSCKHVIAAGYAPVSSSGGHGMAVAQQKRHNTAHSAAAAPSVKVNRRFVLE